MFRLHHALKRTKEVNLSHFPCHFVANLTEGPSHRNRRQDSLMKQKGSDLTNCFPWWIFWTSFNPYVSGEVARWPFPRISIASFSRHSTGEFNIAFYWLAAWPHWHARKWGARTGNFFGGRKPEVCFYASYLNLNELIGYVFFVGFWWNVARIFARYKRTKSCEALMEFEISFLWIPGGWQRNFVLSNFKIDFLGNQSKYRKSPTPFF